MRRLVFVSSTYRDLIEHRKVVWDVLGKFDVDVRGMEAFGARAEPALETCLAEVEQSDIYVGIIGHSLGTVDESSGKSYTQLEYDRARDLKRDILIFIMDDTHPILISQIDRDPRRAERLEAFKGLLRE